jgi:hypothetical protein
VYCVRLSQCARSNELGSIGLGLTTRRLTALALAFAVRAGIAGKHEYTSPRLAIQVEQELLVISQLLLLVVHVDLSKALLHRAGMTSRSSRFAYATYVVALLCFILSTVAISRSPDPVNSLWPDLQVSV